LDGCALNLSISALACAIAKDKSEDEINLLSAFFTQLGDSLQTLIAVEACNNNENNIV
jgi:hypothetical protein